jgi:hypothetical protein
MVHSLFHQNTPSILPSDDQETYSPRIPSSGILDQMKIPKFERSKSAIRRQSRGEFLFCFNRSDTRGYFAIVFVTNSIGSFVMSISVAYTNS